MGFTGPGGRQLVLCGGGAELKGIADFAQGVLGRSVRVGRPRGLVGLPEAQSTAAFSTLAGLALFAGSDNVEITSIGMQENAAPRPLGNAMLGKLIQRSEEPTSEVHSLMRISYAVFCSKKKKLLLQLLSIPSQSLLSSP